MRIVHVRQGREIDLQDIFVVPILEEAQVAVIAVRKGGCDLLRFSLLWRGGRDAVRRGRGPRSPPTRRGAAPASGGRRGA